MRRVRTTADYERDVAAVHALLGGMGVASFQGGAPAPLPPGLQPPPPDGYKERLLKYIPAEVVTLYVTLKGIIASTENAPVELWWVVFLFCLAATPAYLWRIGGIKSTVHLLISTGAFVVWSLAIGGGIFTGVHLLVGPVVLPLYTFTVALIEPRQ